MQTWQQLMEQGNNLYAKEELQDALSYYHQAIISLENSASAEITEIQQVIQGWISGYHSIAVIYERQGFIKLSRDALVTPFQRMLALSYNPKTAVEIKLIANFSLRMTLPPLLEFVKTHPCERQFINHVVEQLNSYDQQKHSFN